MMDSSLRSLPPGDPKLIDSIVTHLKCEGIFDEFRKACLADVDTKPAYQNLRTRVEGFAEDYLNNTQWRPGLNKNQQRDGLRRSIQESGLLTSGVDRIIDQIVSPKIVPFFLPKIFEIVCRLLGIVKQECPAVSSTVLTAWESKPKNSSESAAVKAEATESAAVTELIKDKILSSSQTKSESKSTKAGSSDGVKSKDSKSVINKSKNQPTQSSSKPSEVNKGSKSTDDVKSTPKKSSSQDSVSPKMKSTESPKRDEGPSKKHTDSKSSGPPAKLSIADEKDTKKGGRSTGKDEAEKGKVDKKNKSKLESREETKSKLPEKPKSSEKGTDNKGKSIDRQKSVEGEKGKLKESPSSKDKPISTVSKTNKNFEKALMSCEGDRISSSQPTKSPSVKDDKSSGKKEPTKGRSEEKSKSQTAFSKDKARTPSKKSDSKSLDHKRSNVEGKPPWKERPGTEGRSQHASKDKNKRKSEDEGSQEAKKSKIESPSAVESGDFSPTSQDKLKEKTVEEDEGELSDVSVSSVHTSDLSDFDDHISISEFEDEESGSQNKSHTKSPRKDKQSEVLKRETTEDKKAGLKISEDALMSSDELRLVTAAKEEVSNETENNQSEPRRELRRQRKANPKYTSEDFSTIFGHNHDKQSHHSQPHNQREEEKPTIDVKVSSQSSTGRSSSVDKSELLGSPISDTPSEIEDTSKQGISALHSPILSSDEDLSSKSGHGSREGSSPKVTESERKISQFKLQTRSGSSMEDDSGSPQPIISQQSHDSGSNSKKPSKSDSRQRYDSADLYKPRPVIVHSRRRGLNAASTERRDYIENDMAPTASVRASPRSSQNSLNESGSPSRSKKSPNDQSEFHLPLNKRRRVPHV